MLSTLLSCSGEASHVKVLKLAHGLPPAHSVHLGLVRMQEELKSLSGGKMDMDIYPSEQLGSEVQVIQLLQIGSVDITKVSSAALEGFVDEFKVFGIPYIIRSREHLESVLQGEVGEEILDTTTPFLFKGIGYFDAGTRGFYTVNKPVHTPDDLKGLKIRVQKSPIAVEMMQAYQGSATPIDWGELYTALQSSVVDGAENNTPSVTTAFHHEVINYYTDNEHTMCPDVIIISTHTWDNLSSQEQEWVKEAAHRAYQYQTKLWAEQEQESINIMVENGVEIIHPDKEPFIEAAQPMIERYRANPSFTELINKIDAVYENLD